MTALPDTIEIVTDAVLERMATASQSPFYLGLCGSQGSGKSTLTAQLRTNLEASGQRVAALSLDDLYFSRTQRQRLAAEIHPLFATRGPPGTHDVALGEAVFDGLAREGVTHIPRFDKRLDMPLPQARWDSIASPVDVVIFEGWCVGARAQTDDQLATPINALERTQDPDGLWRRAVNDTLKGAYAHLFARLNMLVYLAAPSFDVVAGWRMEQEATLRRALQANGESTDGLMSDDDIARFVRFYERLTRFMLEEMPRRADVTIRIDERRRPLSVVHTR